MAFPTTVTRLRLSARGPPKGPRQGLVEQESRRMALVVDESILRPAAVPNHVQPSGERNTLLGGEDQRRDGCAGLRAQR
jgi:hypothetical protein